jgi:hypothetical protein
MIKKISEFYTHAPTIKNEVAKTLYPTLIGLIASLEYVEEAKELPNQSRLDFYEELSNVLSAEHRSFYLFTDEEIEYKVSILSPIIKEMVFKGQQYHHTILEQNVGKIKLLKLFMLESLTKNYRPAVGVSIIEI